MAAVPEGAVGIEREDEVVAAFYDAACQPDRWDAALVALANATGCVQAALEIFDPVSGPIALRRPLIAPEFLDAFEGYYRDRSELRARTDRFAVGQTFRSRDVMDLSALRHSVFYNEWWLPQGTGGDVLMANVVREARATAVLTAVKPLRRPEFTHAERRLFERVVGHAMRAIAINRRLRLAEARVDDHPRANFAVVDATGQLVSADPETLRQVEELKSQSDAVARLIRAAAEGRNGEDLLHRATDGTEWRLRVVPLPVGGTGWLEIDRPAALLHIERPEDVRRMRIAHLQRTLGLTSAEAAVALEAAKGDGRAAVAARLGIRETTVRAHLSAIFDKTRVHRQAELVRLVQAS